MDLTLDELTPPNSQRETPPGLPPLPLQYDSFHANPNLEKLVFTISIESIDLPVALRVMKGVREIHLFLGRTEIGRQDFVVRAAPALVLHLRLRDDGT